jgi:hypothetical protein
MSVWVTVTPDNAAKMVDVFQRFGMEDPQLTPALFQKSSRR